MRLLASSKMQAAKRLFMVDGFSLLRMYAIGEAHRTACLRALRNFWQFLGFDELVLCRPSWRFPLEDYQTVSTHYDRQERPQALRVGHTIMIAVWPTGRSEQTGQGMLSPGFVLDRYRYQLGRIGLFARRASSGQEIHRAVERRPLGQ